MRFCPLRAEIVIFGVSTTMRHYITSPGADRILISMTMTQNYLFQKQIYYRTTASDEPNARRFLSVKFVKNWHTHTHTRNVECARAKPVCGSFFLCHEISPFIDFIHWILSRFSVNGPSRSAPTTKSIISKCCRFGENYMGKKWYRRIENRMWKRCAYLLCSCVHCVSDDYYYYAVLLYIKVIAVCLFHRL